MLEVCIDSLESACNAIAGGADELEICSSLQEGGFTPSPGLVGEVVKLAQQQCSHNSIPFKPKINVMIRCRGGSDFCYTEQEMTTMLADIDVYKSFGIDRFVFGALTDNQEIDKTNCTRIITAAYPIPLTFHRAFDLCKEPKGAVEDIVKLGFTRLLTSGTKPTADNIEAIELLKCLFKNFNTKIEIMPGAGVNCNNANMFTKIGFKIIHSSCKRIRHLPNIDDLGMGSNELYVTDANIVKELKICLREK